MFGLCFGIGKAANGDKLRTGMLCGRVGRTQRARSSHGLSRGRRLHPRHSSTVKASNRLSFDRFKMSSQGSSGSISRAG